MKCLMFLSVFAYLATNGGAFANDASKFTAEWGGGKWAVCGQHELKADNACIGATSDCANRKMYARNYTDEWAIQMLVATDINANGAKFCPIQIEGKNKNKGNAWTEYASAGSNCVWLCKDGFTGDECSTPVESVAFCDPTKLEAANYSSIRRVESGANVEKGIARFAWNNYESCGVHKGQEHDIILGVVRWTPSGHGAFVQQLIVRAERSGWKHMDSWASIYPAAGASPILTCKSGYKPNVARTDCDEIDMTLCAQAQTCTGWSAGFDAQQHIMVKPDGNTCYQYRCSETGYAFRSDSDRTCVECANSLRNGVHSKNGTCIQCEVGKMFNADTDSCTDAIGYVKTDMQYGQNQTNSSLPDLKKQCWVIASPEEYKACVISGGKQEEPAAANTIAQ